MHLKPDLLFEQKKKSKKGLLKKCFLKYFYFKKYNFNINIILFLS